MITAGVADSRVTCSEMERLVSLTERVLEGPSGNAEEKVQSSSSAAGATGGAGFGLAKSNIEG